jgi:2-oxoglutarate ferredoxin oxidoreductase subunit gamma
LKVEIRISGLGGQGVVLAGQILGRAAAYDGKHVVQTQSYGAEARGSAAKSEVIISDDKIGFPMVRKCDVLIALSQEAAEKNIDDLKEEGTLLVDSSNVKNVKERKTTVCTVQATQIAEACCGEKLYANIVMLGALTKITQIVSVSAIEKAIQDSVARKDIDKNMLAYQKGIESTK